MMFILMFVRFSNLISTNCHHYSLMTTQHSKAHAHIKQMHQLPNVLAHDALQFVWLAPGSQNKYNTNNLQEAKGQRPTSCKHNTQGNLVVESSIEVPFANA